MELVLELPEPFTIVAQDYVDFEPVLGWFNWNPPAGVDRLVLDFRRCTHSNYQTLALLLEYVWTLHARGIRIEFWYEGSTAHDMWTHMGARGWSQVLNSEHVRFVGSERKPLIAVRTTEDRKYALKALEEYTSGFPIDYSDYLGDVVNEILYNALEHGEHFENNLRIPSLVQFSWYQIRDELSILVTDTGIGVKRHLEKHYKAFENDAEALRQAIQPETSGTFGQQSGYGSRNNAGMGLFVSSRLMQSLRGDMWIVSGNGQLHVSPREITTRELSSAWPGTFVLLNIRLWQAPPEIPHTGARSALMDEARQAREKRTNGGDRIVISMQNHFGRYPEDKAEAVRFRDRVLMQAVHERKPILLDFKDVETATHSFLNALLAGPIRAYAEAQLNPYKYVRSTNDNEGVRQTIQFILDTNV